MGVGIKRSEVGFDKNGVKTPVCFSEPSAYCCGSHFPYESELSTGSPPHISSGACATQKNKLAINRDKPLVLKTVGSILETDMVINRIKTVYSTNRAFGNITVINRKTVWSANRANVFV